MQPVSRLLMFCVLIAAPWCLAGAPLVFQPWLFGGILLATIVGILGDFSTQGYRTFHWSTLAFPLLGTALLALAGLQLLPIAGPPELSHAVLTSTLHVLDGGDGPAGPSSLYPAETRLAMARVALAISAFLGGAWLFSSNSSRRWLWTVLATNGAALVVFGLIQKATWNERIYWTIPLRFGGQPFASFVNRNNAAGYLAICLAVSLGLLIRDRNRLNPDQDSYRNSGSRLDRYESGLILGRQFLYGIIALLSAGILATISRGGIISALAAFLVALVWLGGFRKWRFLVIPLGGTLLIATGLIVWIGIGGQLHYRLASLQQPLSEDGRAFHCADMINAIRDFPVLGTGLGTYRYANKPYQNHFSHGWYVNADNQYLEWFVELGIPGLLFVVAGLTLLSCLCWDWRRRTCPPETLVCGFLLISQGMQSLTDFGVTVTANLITLAVVLGSLSVSDIRDRVNPLSTMERLQRALDQRRVRFLSIGVAVTLIVIAGSGLAELTTAAATAGLRDQIPLALDKPERLTLPEVDGLLIEGTSLLNWRPDDAELHATMAQLWFYRYRLELLAAVNKLQGKIAQETDANWARTELNVLLSEVCRLKSTGATDSLEELHQDPIAVLNLGPAWQHMNLACKACPLLPKLGTLHAAIGILKGEDGRPMLRREAALSPCDPAVLRRAAFYADRLGDRELFMACLQRQLQFKPDQVENLMAQAVSHLQDSEIVANVLPQNPETLVRIAETWKSGEGRRAAISKANSALQQARMSPGQRPYLAARLAILDSQPELVRKHFGQAIQENPLEVTWRLHYAEFLAQQSDLPAAYEQAEICRALAPNDAALRIRLEKLRQQLLRKPASPSA